MSAIFGWHGFSFVHPEDWAPVALSGDRRSGYARLASPRSASLQVRWAPSGSETLDRSAQRYLDKLSADARRSKKPFSRDVDAESETVTYRYRGALDADGVLFKMGDGRIAFLEAVGDSSTLRKRLLDAALASFETAQAREIWSVLGLRFSVPTSLRIETKEFLAGRTTLKLAGRGLKITAERWGLAESLLAKRSIQEWATARIGKDVELFADGPGYRGSRKRPFAQEHVLLIDQPSNNQITLLRVNTRSAEWRPTWDWLI